MVLLVLVYAICMIFRCLHSFTVLPRKHIQRRWQQCNPNLPMPDESSLSLKILSSIHSASGISDASFDILDSPDAVGSSQVPSLLIDVVIDYFSQDLSFELEFEAFKWRWDAFLLGPRTSSDIISKHLIMPLITMAHVAYYSADPVSELPEEDLEKVSSLRAVVAGFLLENMAF